MWAVLLQCVCVCVMCVPGASPAPLRPRAGAESESKPASTAEVNVLMYGVLQFSESLHHMYRSTEDRLARVAHAVSRTESLVQRLGQDAEQAARAEGQIKERLGLIQAQMEALQAQTQQTKGLVNKVEQEEVELKQKLANLEESLNSSTPDRIKALKEATNKHNDLLKDLITWTKDHKQRLEDQNQQLAELQKQTSDES